MCREDDSVVKATTNVDEEDIVTAAATAAIERNFGLCIVINLLLLYVIQNTFLLDGL